MSVVSDQYAPVRANVLDRLRGRWGTDRLGAREDMNAPGILGFLEAPIGEGDDITYAEASPEQLRQLALEIRDLRVKARVHPLQEEVEDGGTFAPTAAGSKRRELLAEIASEHFRKNMGSWMTSVTAEHDVTATPVEELEELLAGAQYRFKLMKVIMDMMEREVEILQNQVKTKRALADATPAT